MRLVYIPCEVRPAVRGPAHVTDADGRAHPVTAGRLEVVDGPLCVVALWLEERQGRHLVRFKDESECWVFPSPAWRFEPDDWNPPSVRTTARPLEIGLPGRRAGSTA